MSSTNASSQFNLPQSRSAFLATSAAIVAFSATARSASGADLLPVRVGLAPTDATAEAFYGHDNGMFAAAGIDIQLTLLRNTGALAAALVAGSLDVITGSISPIAEGYTRGIDFRVIAPGQIYDGPPAQAPIVVTTGSKITSAAGLNGKVIAVNGLGDLTQLLVLSWLDANGADRSTVKFIEIPFPEMVTALSGGRVDAAVLVEPFVSGARGQVTILSDSMPAIAKRFMVTGWFSKKSWLDANADTAKRFATTMLKVGAWANTHHEESGAILAHYTPLQPDTIRAMTRAVYGTIPLTAAVVQPVIDGTAKYFQSARVSAGNLIWN